MPTVFTVTTTASTVANDGQVSLREAIRAANLNAPVADAPAGSPGLDTIRFSTSLNGQTITLTDLPAFADISEDLNIIGPGADQLTISGSNSVPIFLVDLAEDGGVDVTISGLTLTNGRYHQGGAVHNRGNLTLANTVLNSNFSTIDGGGIYNSGTLTVADSTIAGNVASNHGGGVYNVGILKIANSTISGNTANAGDEYGVGGGMFSAGGTLTLTSSTVTGNRGYSGGGISCAGEVTITNTTISANTSSTHGGGIDNFADLTVDNSTITGNTANGIGGGVLIASGLSSLAITNSTVTGNTASYGGGIYDLGALTVANCTIAGNSATIAGGGIVSNFGEAIKSTIVAGNSAGSAGPDLSGSFILAYSLIQRMGNFTFTESVPGTNLYGLDPLLGPLAMNGGPTLTHALLPGSPALDRGSNLGGLAEDQRGYGSERVIGAAADIGAYESRDSDVRLVPDPLDRTKNVLVVVGTRKSDAIAVRPDDGDVEVTLNGKFFAFDPHAVHRVAAFGMEGNDSIRSALAFGALIDGGRGADTLTGGAGADVLIGGQGADVLAGAGSRDILIGGDGIDRLTGGADDDLLIGGRTVYDNDHGALRKIQTEWTSASSYATRAANLLAGTGVPILSAAQITDGFADTLVGDLGQELFYANPGDPTPNRTAVENLVSVSPPPKMVRR